jgi:hypothetical protein
MYNQDEDLDAQEVDAEEAEEAENELDGFRIEGDTTEDEL